jgi:hypothetical protein
VEPGQPDTSPSLVSTGSTLSTRANNQEDITTQPPESSGTEVHVLRMDVQLDNDDPEEELFIRIMQTLDLARY